MDKGTFGVVRFSLTLGHGVDKGTFGVLRFSLTLYLILTVAFTTRASRQFVKTTFPTHAITLISTFPLVNISSMILTKCLHAQAKRLHWFQTVLGSNESLNGPEHRMFLTTTPMRMFIGTATQLGPHLENVFCAYYRKLKKIFPFFVTVKALMWLRAA